MKIKMNLNFKVVLLIIQVCLIGALDLHDTAIFHNSTLLQTDGYLNFDDTFPDDKYNSGIETGISRQNNLNATLNRELLSLINSLNAFVKVIEEDENLETPATRKKKYRSASEPLMIPPNLKRRIDDINNEISGMKKEVEKMENTPEVNQFTRGMLNHLEAVLENLQKQYDNENRQLSKWNNLQEFIDISQCAVDDMKVHFGQIKLIFNEMVTESKQTSLEEQIIIDIQNREFDNALERLSKLNGKLKDNVDYIVHKVYNNAAPHFYPNFYLLLQFGDRSKDAQTSLRIYQALNYEMESHEHNDYDKILRLIKSLQNNVIANANSSDVLEEAESFKSVLHNVIRTVAAVELGKALASKNDTTVSQIFDHIYVNYPSLYKAVLQQVLGSIIDKIDVQKLIKFFETHKYIPQSLLGYSIIFKELKKRNSLNQKFLVDFAFGLKKVIRMYENVKVPDDERIYITDSEAKQLVNDLPKSLKTLVVADRVCLKHVDVNEYLFAANNYFVDAKSERMVFTWREQSRVSASTWIVQPTGDAYFIKNDEYNEYLYASNDFYNSYNRHVRTLAVTSNQSTWTFEPLGDHVLIRNTYFGENLFSSLSYPYDKEKRYVFSQRPEVVGFSDTWIIEDCTVDCKGDACFPILVRKEI